MTAVRLQLAFDSGLTIAYVETNHVVSANALALTSLEPVAVLSLARVYGLQWTVDYTRNAAFKNDLSLLQWLVMCDCPSGEFSEAHWAVHHGNVEMLKFCHTAIARLSESLKKDMLWKAGKRGHLAILQWLRDKGSAWPATFHGPPGCWTVPAIQWALNNGCTWGSWKCQQARPAGYTCTRKGRTTAEHSDADCTAAWCPKRSAAALFAWAHEHGCPCT
jgi:hypothetical protein